MMTKLPAQIFFAYIGGKSTTYEWQPPEVPAAATTEHLADIYQDFRRWVLEQHGPRAPEVTGQVDIDDAGVRLLLKLAFFASLQVDEGRPTRGMLYVEHPSDGRTLRVVSFEHAEELTDAHIAKLAPTLSANDAVLVVEARDGRIFGSGIAHLDDRQSDAQPLSPPQTWSGRRGGLIVSILGPGVVGLRQGYCDYTLERNRIVGHVAAAAVPFVDEWLVEMQKSLLARRTQVIQESPHFFDDPDAHQELNFVLSRCLETAAQLRHGAAVVVLSDVKAAPITINYRAEDRRGLADLVHGFRVALGEAFRDQNTKEASNALIRCERARHAMLRQAGAVGRLTATDGCVVLDRSFRVRGFGGIIDPALTPEKGRLSFKPPAARPDLTEADLLRRFGTRHRSAYLLCKALQNTLAFVLSQDGGWRVFASDAEHVHFVEHVAP
jgi:hypothetical protein